jgi:ribosomal protein S18 acetylase RimI-like enzyme
MNCGLPYVTIRPAVAADAPDIVRLIRALATEHGRSDYATVTEASIREHGFGERPKFEIWLVCRGEAAVSFAQFYPAYATWRGEPMMILANLYVDPTYRGGGLGRRLMSCVADRARALGCSRIELHVQLDNPKARRFYRGLGFRELDDLRLRIEGEAMARLVAD